MTALTAAAVVMFVLLGRWQWHRAAEKRAVASAFVAGAAAAPSALGSRSTAELARYMPVVVTGHYDTVHQFLLDNISHGRRTGYEVLTPFRLTDGRWLLVNRGWIALPNNRRDTLPDLTMAGVTLEQVSGRVDSLPVTGLAVGQAAPAPGEDWPKRTSFPTTTQLGAALGVRLEPRQLLLGATEAFGYARDWRSASAGFGPERHLGYAVQWWGFAGLSVFLYLFMNLERRRP